MWEEGVGRMEWSVGGKWDNCNSIINKYFFKKRKTTMPQTLSYVCCINLLICFTLKLKQKQNKQELGNLIILITQIDILKLREVY